MTNFEHALHYAKLGYRVFPLHHWKAEGSCSCGKPDCTSPAKHPRTPNGLHDGSTDQSIISQWWGTWPEANIGIVTGQVSKIVVLDIDMDHGGYRTLDELELKHGKLPATHQVTTGGGGRHIYFEIGRAHV